jgi:hypothetical protein
MADETNRGRIMSLFGLINRGLGPMGSFPFGLIATIVGAPWTVAVCGLLTVGSVAYAVRYRTDLRHAKPSTRHDAVVARFSERNHRDLATR